MLECKFCINISSAIILLYAVLMPDKLLRLISSCGLVIVATLQCRLVSPVKTVFKISQSVLLLFLDIDQFKGRVSLFCKRVANVFLLLLISVHIPWDTFELEQQLRKSCCCVQAHFYFISGPWFPDFIYAIYKAP